MCDYCDCRLIPEIAGLTAEHGAVREAMAAVRRGDGEALARLRRVLDAHTAREEAGVFTRLRERGEVAYVGRLEDEHRAIEAALVPEAARADVVEALAALERHIAVEESDLFPAARQVLTDADWDAIAAS